MFPLSGWVFGLVAASLFIAAESAAFCGFYVAQEEGSLVNDATQVVMMRAGKRTVLNMQNNYKGPPEDFAMVVPVPVVLSEDEVKTLDPEVFERVEALSAPRLVEYWEQDPCRPVPVPQPAPARIEISDSTMVVTEEAVEVLAQFAVGEYEVVILGARDSAALDQWLKQNGYRIPEGAEPVLRPYVEQGMKFFVAKVDSSKVEMKDGEAELSPLRFHYDTEEFSLPVRLGLLNSAGTQDLIVNILADRRYEVANYDNVTVPTNIDVGDQTRQRFADFYAAVFDATLAKHPGSVVTEYAWDWSTCDPCPVQPLQLRELTTLGYDVVRPAPPGPQKNSVAILRTEMVGPSSDAILQVPTRLRPGLRACYGKALKRQPTFGGRMGFHVAFDEQGKVNGFGITRNAFPRRDVDFEACVEARARKFWVNALKPYTPREVGIDAQFGEMRPATPTPNFVLTRLHARYDKAALREDLVFKAAPPIAGGSESGRPPPQGAERSSINAFQARYAIRHEWTGPIECDNPQQGLWGGPPGGQPPAPLAGADLNKADRSLPLPDFLRQSVPELGIEVAASGTDRQEKAAVEPPVQEPQTVDALPVSAGGCGSCALGTERRAGLGWGATLLVLLVGVRRKHGIAGFPAGIKARGWS